MSGWEDDKKGITGEYNLRSSAGPLCVDSQREKGVTEIITVMKDKKNAASFSG